MQMMADHLSRGVFRGEGRLLSFRQSCAIARRLRRPRAWVVRAWFWLAAHTDSLTEKRRCLEAILELEPDSEPANAALY